jgi:hypothetical protein
MNNFFNQPVEFESPTLKGPSPIETTSSELKREKTPVNKTRKKEGWDDWDDWE